MSYAHTAGGENYRFADLKEVLAKASPARSGDYLAGVAAANSVERMAARMCLAELPVTVFLNAISATGCYPTRSTKPCSAGSPPESRRSWPPR